jgi:hypothetical protein
MEEWSDGVLESWSDGEKKKKEMKYWNDGVV